MSIPSKIKIVLCAFNGNYAENLFNFKNYQLNIAEVMVDGVPFHLKLSPRTIPMDIFLKLTGP